jgi:hypothetical protein
MNIPLLALLLALALPVTRDEVSETVAQFLAFYKGNKSPAEKIEAIHVLDRVDHPKAVEALVVCFDDEDFSVRQTAIEVLGNYRNPECAQWLVDNLVTNKRARIEHRRIAVSALGAMKYEAGIPAIRELLKERDVDTLRCCAEALGAMAAKDAAKDLTSLLANTDATVRIAALDALGIIGEPSVAPEVLAQLSDDRWQVRSAAVSALALLREKSTVQPLIDQLRKEDGRLQDEISKALLSLTTFDVGHDPDKWQERWDRVKDRFVVPSLEEIRKVREAHEKSQLRYNPGTDDFAGIPTKSRRIIYVVDISGSMEEPLINREKFLLQGRTYNSLVKMEVVKSELIRTIENLDDRVFFNVIAFASKTKKWQDRGLVQANILNRKSAAKWVGALKPVGGASQNLKRRAGLTQAANSGLGKTNFHDALMEALDAKAAQAGYDTNLGSQVDTIFFLSDGDPTEGPITEQDRLLAEVRRVNQLRKIMIHTINIGRNERGKLLMQGLAQQNGGTFLDLGE